MSAPGTGISGAGAGAAEASPAGCGAGDDASLLFLWSLITFFSAITSLFFYSR
jgi:hypothetical protein